MPTLKHNNGSVKVRFLAAGFAAGLTGILSLPASADPATPLMSARTIQVHEKVFSLDKNGALKPAYEIDLRIARPGQVKALITAAPLGKTHQYVADGKAEQEYNAKTNTFRTMTLPKSGRSYSTFRSVAQVDLILGNGQLPAPKTGVQRTVTAETVNNIPMTVTTDTLPPEMSRLSGTNYVIAHKLWIVTKTGLPYRYASTSTTDGKTTLTEDETFTDWRFDQPLTASQMAFAPPADAKAYVEPKFEMTTLAVGTVAPDFSAITPDGKTVHLSDFKGRVVVLDFWATWCHPCQDAMPHLESVYRQIKGQNVAVLGLCVWDNKVSYDKWVTDKVSTYTFPTAFDPAGNGKKSIAVSLYNMNAIPTQYVIGKDGKIAAAYVGDEGQQLEKALVAQGITVSLDTKAAITKP